VLDGLNKVKSQRLLGAGKWHALIGLVQTTRFTGGYDLILILSLQVGQRLSVFLPINISFDAQEPWSTVFKAGLFQSPNQAGVAASLEVEDGAWKDDRVVKEIPKQKWYQESLLAADPKIWASKKEW
jgi:hypothetical protein